MLMGLCAVNSVAIVKTTLNIVAAAWFSGVVTPAIRADKFEVAEFGSR
jgi:hypothetical protein